MMLMSSTRRRRNRIDPTRLPAARLIPAPIGARRLARVLIVVFVLCLVVLALAPWQQNVSGSGRVIAFSPVHRQQKVQSPVKGRIVRWLVTEGQRVEAGTVLAELEDNDPEYFERLRASQNTVEAQREVYASQVEQLGGYVSALAEARDRAVDEARTAVEGAAQKVRAAEQKLGAADAARETAEINRARTLRLFEQGLVSQRKKELAELKARKASADHTSARADLEAAQQALSGKRAALANKRAEAEAKVENARASQGKAKASLEQAKAKMLDVETKLARQRNQTVVAPFDAYVLSIDKLPGQEQIKQGDTLAVLVPDVSERVAEVKVDGNDAAIIQPGRKARLQFEGWPAVQFSGWPSVAVGTFGGIVKFVDAAGDGKGDFRVLIAPDPDEPEWPEARFLRQSTRAKAWILLDQVTLGYELWRRFNGFPPALDIGKEKKSEPGAKAGKGHSK